MASSIGLLSRSALEFASSNFFHEFDESVFRH